MHPRFVAEFIEIALRNMWAVWRLLLCQHNHGFLHPLERAQCVSMALMVIKFPLMPDLARTGQ